MTAQEERSGGDAAIVDADDLLREVSDPTTPGERLHDLLRAAFAARREEPSRRVYECLDAIVRNPSLPLDALRTMLLRGQDNVLLVGAWYNPCVPVLLVAEPLPDYPSAALRMLRLRGASEAYSAMTSTDGLDWAVARWAAASPDEDAESRALARHLAGLFGLPWPQEGP